MAVIKEADLLQNVVKQVEDRLPSGWTLTMEQQVQTGDLGVDGVVRLRAPDGRAGTLLIEAKQLVSPRDVPAALDQLSLYRTVFDSNAVPMVIARYLAPSTREQLEARGASYADATGNLWISLDDPPLFIRDRGAARDPWRGPGRPRGTLKGPPAGRVVRALADFAPPFSVAELVQRSGASTGATYRVVEFLEQEMLIRREPRGPIVECEWRRLLMRWSEDYGFQRSNAVTSYLEPRGLPVLTDALPSVTGLRYAITGSLAAARLASYAAVRSASLYVDDPADAADRLGLRAVESGANVLLAKPDDDSPFDRTADEAGLRYAAPSQVAVDLLTGPGRSPSEAEALLDWMEANEPQWRH